ncbi:MAG: glycosyltransferase family 2 protein [Muribaculaceae bacterium]|nr:glycosyltransferase family 2 protein [Muribaculaceae bacterium]MDE7080449.1 glycosyltransferase family 2 protein [Muribaculaceae bacterium]
MPLKKIIAMTMVRNDRFLPKWVEYYGRQLGMSHLRIFFDGEDQEIPPCCAGAVVEVLPKMQGDVVATDRQRARFMSARAAALMADEGADMVIATDADEFLVPDPALGLGLAEFLSRQPDRPCYSGLGVDVLQHLPTEGAADFSRPFLAQRHRGWLYSRYTKPSVITRPLTWGGGYHRVKGTDFHIVRHLYLFHFGGVDQESLRQISADATRVDNGWTRHQLKRQRALQRISRVRAIGWERGVRLARLLQSVCRPIFALNKPSTYGLRIVARIPERFSHTV